MVQPSLRDYGSAGCDNPALKRGATFNRRYATGAGSGRRDGDEYTEQVKKFVDGTRRSTSRWVQSTHPTTLPRYISTARKAAGRFKSNESAQTSDARPLPYGRGTDCMAKLRASRDGDEATEQMKKFVDGTRRRTGRWVQSTHPTMLHFHGA